MGRRDLRRLARVSKDWQTVAMPLIWQSVSGLQPLVRLMPEDARSVVDVPPPPSRSHFGSTQPVEVIRPLTEADWIPVYKWSCLVKTFELVAPEDIWGSRKPSFTQTLVEAITSCPPSQSLLPNVHDLRFDVSSGKSEVFSALFDMLITPKLTSLVVTPTWEEIIRDPPLLAERCAGIERLHLVGSDHLPGATAHSSAMLLAISRWSHLQSVQLRNVACLPDLLPTLAQKTTLTSLKLNFRDIAEASDIAPSSLQPGFLALQEISMGCLTIASATAVMRAWDFHKLETIHFTSLYAGDIRAQDVQVLLQAIHDHTSHDILHEIRIQGFECVFSPLLLDHIRPISDIRGLSHLELNATGGVKLTDEDHAQVASWWPEMQEFEMNTMSIHDRVYWDAETPATLEALFPYARCCPKLRQLSIPLSAYDIPPRPTSAVSKREHALRTLRVGDSPLDDDEVTNTAIYLLALFPKLDTVDYDDQEWSEPWSRMEDALERQRWLSRH